MEQNLIDENQKFILMKIKNFLDKIEIAWTKNQNLMDKNQVFDQQNQYFIY